MIRFHNRVIDEQPKSLPDTVKFSIARELVTKHYQWMLRHDYVPRIVQASIVKDVR